MQISKPSPTPPRRGCVTAIFEDGPQSFDLAKGATLEVLSIHLTALRRPDHGKLLDITVKFEGAPRRVDAGHPRRTPGHGVRISG